LTVAAGVEPIPAGAGAATAVTAASEIAPRSADGHAGWVAQAVGIQAILAGYAVAQTLPVLITTLTAALGLNVQQAAWLAFADLGTSTVSSLLGAWLIRHRPLPALARYGTVITIFGNLACFAVRGFGPLFALRLVSGCGEGLMVAVGTAVLARARSPERAFAFAACGQTVVGAVGVAVIPTIVALWGWNSFFIVIALFAAPGLIGASWLTDGQTGPRQQRTDGFSMPAWIAIAAMTITYLGIGGIWANLGALGQRSTLSLPAIGYGISIATLSAPAGTIIAAIMGNRAPSSVCISVGIAALVSGTVILETATGSAAFTGGSVVFMFGWALFVPYANGITAVLDKTGAATVVATACAGGGLAVGPLVVVPLIGRWGYGAVPPLTAVLVLLSYCMFMPLALMTAKRR
jgi:predicted MFS family arabinose efflux permease